MTPINIFSVVHYSVNDSEFIGWNSLEENVIKETGKYEILNELAHFFLRNYEENVNIPSACVIKHLDIVRFLINSSSIFFENWERLALLYKYSEDFFNDPEVNQLIADTQEDIRKCFRQFSLPISMHNWMRSIDGYYFMVRSTGIEDGENAYAGVNLSCKYKKRHEVPASIGDVIASYIDKRALYNRIIAGENPFKTPLKLAVMVQELIGEPLGGAKNLNDIPISVVLFSNEPQYVNGESFRIMKLSATYGHGDGVVGNLNIETDTFYILQSRANDEEIYVWEDIQEKPERLVPVQKEKEVELEAISNPSELLNRSALDHTLLKRLFTLGIKVENYFNMPMDMELVVKGKTIHIVQARQINRLPNLPSYIDFSTSQLKQCTPVRTIVSSDSSAIFVDSEEKILSSNTLEEAQFAFDPRHKIVVVKEEEPLNSHPIINMTERGIPCLQHEDALEPLISKWKESSTASSLAICVQSNVVGIAENNESVVIKKGFISHPAPLRYGVDKAFKSISMPCIPFDIQELLKEIKLAHIRAVAQSAFKRLLTHEFIQNISEKIHYPGFTAKKNELQNRINITLNELGATLKQAQEGERMEILFYAKAFETLIYGTGCSILSLTALDNAFMGYQNKLGEKTAIFAEESLIKTVTPEISTIWQQFLLEIEKNSLENEIHQLKEILNNLSEIKPFWLTFYFMPLTKRFNSSFDILRNILSGISGFTDLVNQTKRIERSLCRLQIDQFASPPAFKRISVLINDSINIFQDPEFILKFKAASPIAKMIVCQTLIKAIDTYDRALKTVKTSNQYPLHVKVSSFIELLKPYMSLMKTIGFEYLKDGVFTLPDYTLKKYFSEIDDILLNIQNVIDKSDRLLSVFLLPSRDFNVSTAVLGSGTLFSRHLPHTLEDIFTLTHQNLLACVANVMSDLVNLDDSIPIEIQYALDLASSFRRAQMIGIKQNNDEILIYYNSPLRYHSSTFQLKYKDNLLSLQMQFLGEARNRWNDINEYVQILDKLNIINIQHKTLLRGNHLQFEWALTNRDQAILAFNILNTVCDFSNIETTSNLTDDLVKRGYENKHLIDIAVNYCKSSDEIHTSFGMQLMFSLIRSKLGVEEALQLVITTDKSDVFKDILLTALVESGYAIDNAFERVMTYNWKKNGLYNKSLNRLFIALLAREIGRNGFITIMKYFINANRINEVRDFMNEFLQIRYPSYSNCKVNNLETNSALIEIGLILDNSGREEFRSIVNEIHNRLLKSFGLSKLLH